MKINFITQNDGYAKRYFRYGIHCLVIGQFQLRLTRKQIALWIMNKTDKYGNIKAVFNWIDKKLPILAENA